MSSTKRGQRGGENTDTFPTPAWCGRRLVEMLHRAGRSFVGDVLEPCAGDGSIIAAINASHYPAVRSGALRWHAVELRSFDECQPSFGLGGDCVTHRYDTNFLEWAKTTDDRFDCIITNPPFKDALEIAKAALKLLKPDGTLFLLLRINWLGGASRFEFIKDNTPNLYVVPNRPSFTSDGKTDSIEYAWWEFPGVGDWELCDLTSITERKAERIEEPKKPRVKRTKDKAALADALKRTLERSIKTTDQETVERKITKTAESQVDKALAKAESQLDKQLAKLLNRKP